MITQDYQAELRGYTVGVGQPWRFVRSPIGGLGGADVRRAIIVRDDAHGVVAPADRAEIRPLSLPLYLTDGPETVMEHVTNLCEAWSPAERDVFLDLRLPGQPEPVLRYYGRPGTIDLDQGRMVFGYATAMAPFDAHDPVRYGAEQSVIDSGTFTITNSGTAPTNRATIVLTGDGGVPSLANATDGGGNVLFTLPLAVGATWTIDLRARTVLDGAGNDVFGGNVVPSSLWFKLRPGVNNLTLAGAAQADVLFRPGWW